jgi:hypothetical protein
MAFRGTNHTLYLGSREGGGVQRGQIEREGEEGKREREREREREKEIYWEEERKRGRERWKESEQVDAKLTLEDHLSLATTAAFFSLFFTISSFVSKLTSC